MTTKSAPSIHCSLEIQLDIGPFPSTSRPVLDHGQIAATTQTTVVIGWLLCLGFAVASIDEVVFWPGFVPQLH